MTFRLLAVSDVSEDVDFVQRLATRLGGDFDWKTNRDGIREVLAKYPDTLIFWDAEDLAKYEAISEVLPKYVKPNKLFAITSKPMAAYPDLFRVQIFDHHLVRSFADPAIDIYEKLVHATTLSEPPGLSHYFAENTPIKKITITKSTQKTAAIEAIHNYLSSQRIGNRLPALVAQAADELILNAIFDAPVTENGQQTRWTRNREEACVLSEREQVTFEITSSKDIIGLCVSDQFGSLRRSVLLDSIGMHYRRAQLSTTSATEAGMGLRGILATGLSMIVVTVPGFCTNVMLFIRKTENVKTFKAGFRFFSMFAR